MVGVNLVFKKMVVMIPADFRERVGERCFLGDVVELIAAPAGSKADIIMKLISPAEFGEGLKKHGER